MAEEAKKWNFNATQSVLTVGKKLKLVAKNSKERLEKLLREIPLEIHYIFTRGLSSLYLNLAKTQWAKCPLFGS